MPRRNAFRWEMHETVSGGMPAGRSCLQRMPFFKPHALALLFALGVALSGIPPAAAAAVTVSVERTNDDVIIEASARLKARAETAWRILTAYDRYAEFIPGVRSSEVRNRHGHTVTVEQNDDAAWWSLRMPLHVTYEITEFPPDRLLSRGSASALPALESSYVLTPTAMGVRLDYAGRVAHEFGIFGHVEQWVIQRRVLRQFQALADEIERRNEADAGEGHSAPN